jgi:hypothetical protein
MEFPISIIKRIESVKAGSILNFLTGIVLILFCSAQAFGQEKLIQVYPTAGISWRSTAMNFFNFKAIIREDPTKPYHYEKNVQGFSLNPGILIKAKTIGVEYYSNLRYDVISGTIGQENKFIKEFIIDHNFNLIISRKIDFGLGLTIVNAGEGYAFVNPIPRYHNIEFKTYNLFVTVPVKKLIQLEIKALYIPKDFPENREEKYLMYSLRVYYKFNFLNKQKE